MTNKSPAKHSFSYDGNTLSNGRIRVPVQIAFIEETSIPREFLTLLLKKETSAEAWNLYNFINTLTQREDAKKFLMDLACSDGIDMALEQAKKFKTSKPKGKVQFCFGVNSRLEPVTMRLELTDGEEAFTFYADFPTNNLDLPVNIYTNVHYRDYHLDAEKFLKIESCADEFFHFLVRLQLTAEYVKQTLREKAIDAFWTNKKEAYTILTEIERRANYRKKRDETISNLQINGIIAFDAGFLVRYSWPEEIYYITREGHVYKLEYKTVSIRKEAVFRSVEKGKPPKNLVPVCDPKILREIAQIVGRVKPEFCLVIQ